MDNELLKTVKSRGYARILVQFDASKGISNKDALDLSKHFLEPNFQHELSKNFEKNYRSVAIGENQTRVYDDSIEHDFAKSLEPRLRVYPKLGLAIGLLNEANVKSLEEHAFVTGLFLSQSTNLIRAEQTKAGQRTKLPSKALQMLRLPELWSQGLTGKGVLIGHLDTGVDVAHPSLQSAVSKFVQYDFHGDPVLGSRPHDSGTHGTHTAGLIAARADDKGAFGAAPGSSLASAVVVKGGDEIKRMLAGFEWMISVGVNIINGSIGQVGENLAFESIVDALARNNILPVFAIGNEGAGLSRFPANYEKVLSVGACDLSGKVERFSGSQFFTSPKERIVPTIIAPGVNILSSFPGNKYRKLNGSSQAAPMISGLAALLMQAVPTASAEDIKFAIKNSAKLAAGESPYRGNNGVPDGVEALRILENGNDFA